MFSSPIISELTELLRRAQAEVTDLEKKTDAARDKVVEWSRLIELAQLNSDPEPAFDPDTGYTPFPVPPLDGTVPIGGVAPKSIVSCPDWNGGRPVKIHTIEDSEIWPDNTFVVYRDADATDGPCQYVHVPQDMQVTPWPVKKDYSIRQDTPAWFRGPDSPGVDALKEATR